MPGVVDIFYLLLNAFRIYIMYKFIGIFFTHESRRKWVPYGYGIYYLLNSAGYLFINYAQFNLAVILI